MAAETVKTTFAPLVLRLALGALFLYHGLVKVTGPGNDLGAAWANAFWQKQQGPPQDVLAAISSMETDRPEELKNMTEENFSYIVHQVEQAADPKEVEVPGTLQGHAAQLAVAWGEVLGGVALLLGLLTRVAAAGMIVIQAGAIYFVSAPKGLPLDWRGDMQFQFNVALIVMCLALVILGAGAVSVDRLLRRRRKEKARQEQAHAPAGVS